MSALMSESNMRLRSDARRTRERLLEVAARLVADAPGTSMSDLAAAAGVGRSTLHRHFPSRRDLDEALRERTAGASLDPPPVVAPAGGPLDEVPPHLVPEQLVAEARRVAGVPLALYLVDVDGSALLRIAGEADALPGRIEAPVGLGQEIALDALPELEAHVARALPGCTVVPLWLRGRATGVLLAVGVPRASLAELAREGAAALELANGSTDVLEVVRRRRATTPAAEMQLDLLPGASIVRVAGADVAGGVLPSAAVGGDWFDLADNPDGAWLAIADVEGDGLLAAGRAALALGALRAARRQGGGLEASARAVHELLHDAGASAAVVLAQWSGGPSALRWTCCGHPPPLLVSADGDIAELGDAEPALGAGPRAREVVVHERRLARGERVVLASDGALGPLGVDGVATALRGASSASAAAGARAILAAAGRPPEDDACVVVLAVGGGPAVP
jgi:AcrR family transcriptional regulator